MVQKGQKSPKVDIEPYNSQPTYCLVTYPKCNYQAKLTEVATYDAVL